jgi:hypothetical protein
MSKNQEKIKYLGSFHSEGQRREWSLAINPCSFCPHEIFDEAESTSECSLLACQADSQ